MSTSAISSASNLTSFQRSTDLVPNARAGDGNCKAPGLGSTPAKNGGRGASRLPCGLGTASEFQRGAGRSFRSSAWRINPARTSASNAKQTLPG
jgi:hypothetical protein